MDTKRQQLIDLVIARLQGIRLDRGFQSDLGAKVEDWPRRYSDEELDQLPARAALGVYDVTEDADKGDRESDLTVRTLTIQVRIYVTSDTPARDLRAYIGDVEAAIRQDPYWNELSVGTNPRRAGMIIPSEAMDLAGAAVEFDIGYTTQTFNPYE